jgi:uncharacterized protein
MMMRSVISRVGVVASLMLGLMAPMGLQAKESPIVSSAAITKGAPALWEVKGKRGKLYLFGTFHALPVGLEWKTTAFEKAIAKSDRLVTEVVISDIKDPKVAGQLGALMATKGFAGPEDKSAAVQLTPAQLALLERSVVKNGLPKEVASRMKPWFATLMLAQGLVAEAGYVPELGAEQQIVKAMATKPNLGLETVIDQINLFADMDSVTANQALKETLDENASNANSLKELSTAWAKGDLVVITQQMVSESIARYPQFHKTIFTDRNAKWVPKLENYLSQKGTTFVAVGAGHYLGDGGLLDLMAQKGYKIKRVQ